MEKNDEREKNGLTSVSRGFGLLINLLTDMIETNTEEVEISGHTSNKEETAGVTAKYRINIKLGALSSRNEKSCKGLERLIGRTKK